MASLQYRNVHFVLKKVSENGFNLRHAVSFADDIDVVTAALQSRGAALQFASERFRGERKMVVMALQNDGTAIGFAAAPLKDDVELALMAVQQTGVALRDVGEEARKLASVTRAAVSNDGLALELADDAFRSDVDVVSLAVQQNPRAVQYAHFSILAANPNGIVTDALAADPSLLSLLLGRMKRASESTQRAFFRTVVRGNPAAVASFPKSAVIAESALLKEEILPASPAVLEVLPLACKMNEELVLSAVSADGNALQYAPAKMRRRRALVEAAVQRSAEALQFASADFQDDAELKALAGKS